ncbi:uncharacterized protein C1orf112 homolog [Manduca sexta]|uniref:Uncharacterized protein n=1 Tax=Manduca sexta TaxID=7130 RepID=A0A921ZGV9_MANSE|nr:uncharacterized protein C1orf112 homolog [Manduca sexta]KAG6456759.1 hypothetical protein O3G_MSEX009947 [Manduca sexta]
MDESQSSDFFSETDLSYNNSVTTDSIPYETLIMNTKLALKSESRNEIKKSTFSTYFTSLMEDCQSCISQALDLIINILSDTDIQMSSVVEYINDAVSLLVMLSDFIKTVIESVSMTCQRMKIFPKATADIILKIFMHCKDSEYLYGPYLNKVEKELKDLFRSCHELQLTYLMIMEKHFVFDITEKEDVDTLTDALDINLKIGDIVQTLDVKTMAEQWKAFIAICEKYSNTLIEKNVYNNSINILSEMIENNIKTALERDQEDKVIVRSLKVASFSIKILLKISFIFKHASFNNHDGMFNLIVLIYSNNKAFLEVDSEKSSQFLQLMNSNVSQPADLLLKQLLTDIKFCNYLLDYDMRKLQSEDKLVGYILIIIAMIKSTLHRDDNLCLPKHKLIRLIYNVFQHCHSCMNIGLKFPTEENTYLTQGLYEHLLIHFVAFATTLNSEAFTVLETNMTDAILGSDCMAALFSTNTWSLLARVMPSHLLLSQLISLCKIYQELEKITLFSHSPQKVHLSYTIGCLFEAMQNGDKLKIYKLFNVTDEKYYDLWTSLQIRNLPEYLQFDVEGFLIEKLKTQLRKISTTEDSGEVEKMIKIMNLTATCSINNNLIDCVLKGWEKACLKNNLDTISELSKETLWYLNYINSLTSFTVSIENHENLQSIYIIKILHVIAEVVKGGNTELKLTVINNVCNIIPLEISDANKFTVESLLIHALKYLSKDTQDVVKFKLFSTLRGCIGSHNLHRLVKVISKDDMRDVWNTFMKHGVLKRSNNWKEQLLTIKDYKYRHKCLESNMPDSKPEAMKKTCSGNFELADIDSLFENDSDQELPVHKKLKLNPNEADAIISRLENDVSLLCKVKHIFTSEQKTRIESLYDQLRNICD